MTTMMLTYAKAQMCKLWLPILLSLALLGACAEEKEVDQPKDATASSNEQPGTPTIPEPDVTPVTPETPVTTGVGSANGIVTNTTITPASTATSYSWGTLTTEPPSNKVYTDRPAFTYSVIPQQYDGFDVLRTANDDKSSTTLAISFTLTATRTVYLAYDTRITTLPAWASSTSGWVSTPDTISVASDGSRKVYKKDFPAGSTVTLGPNGSTSFSMYTVFVGPVVNNVPGTQTPVANHDDISTNLDVPVTINVLANDSGMGDAPVTLTIIANAENGSAVAQNNSAVLYTPDTDFVGTDSFSYRIQDRDGDIATASVSVTVICAACAVNRSVTVTWNSNTDQVSGYRVYYGTTLDTATTLARDVPPSSSTTVSQDFNGWHDFGLNVGSPICIAVSAHNSVGESAKTTAQCATL